jgi:hypothetical protein
MRQMIFRRKTVIALSWVILFSMAWMGCSTTVKERQPSQPAGSTGGAKVGGEEVGKYYFDDVIVPSELNYKPNRSFVYETPGFKTGILFFSKWHLDVDSLIEFFNYHMEKDNWKQVNTFRGKESMLYFSKPDKTCAIKIVEKWYGTVLVEIRVGPLGEKKM